MCLYLPEQEIAIEITDDEQSQLFEPEAFPGIRLIRLTKAQVAELINFGNAIQNMRKKENRMRIQIMCSFNKPPMVS